MPHIRKQYAGNDSFGNEWPEDGSVVEVPYEQAVHLLAIADAGFVEVDAPVEPETEPEPVEEPAPEPETPVDEAPKPRQTRARKPKADDTKTVEE